MIEAIAEAKLALAADEVPVGAVVVMGSEIIARAHNTVEVSRDGTLHAELRALQFAAKAVGNRRLSECILYVTLEPCAMCAGACVNARIGALAFGAYDAVAGACGSVVSLTDGVLGNVVVPTIGGIYGEQCGKLLTSYFKEKRR